MPSVKYESSVLSNLPGDLDNLRSRYVDIDTRTGVRCEFPGFEITSIEQNLFRLLSDCESVLFKTDWTMRPDYVSYDKYGTVIYWPFILCVNGVFSIEEFQDLEKVLIPSISAISNVISDKIGTSDHYARVSIPETNRDSMYYRSYPLDPLEAQRIAGRENDAAVTDTTTTITSTNCELREKSTILALTATNIANAYVDLEYAPVNNSSITLLLDPYVTPQSYGYDYVLLYDDQGNYKNKLSWDSDDCTLGSGMEDLLETGDILTVTYGYAQIDCSDCPPYEDDILDGGIFGD